jgi:RNA polymerase sigma-70 factor (ECF subfamily)
VIDPQLSDLFREYSRFVFVICNRYAANREEAEDLTQEVFLLLSRKLGMFRGDSRMSTWIYRIAINLCLDHLRWRKAQRRLEAGYLDELVVKNLSPKGDPVLAKIDLERILSRTNEKTRQILFLSFAEGLTYQEVGEVLRVEASTVAKTIQRFRDKFSGRGFGATAIAGRKENA